MNITILGSVSQLSLVSINIALSIPLNVYVVWLALAGAARTLTSDFFSLNLAVCEILMASSTFISYFGHIYLRSFFSLEALIFLNGLMFTARPLFQCYICVECYVGVVYPVRFLHYKPLRYRVACACVAWLISLISCFYSWYTFESTLYLYAFFIQHILLFFVTSFCCLSVLRTLKLPGPGEQNEKKKINATKRRAFKMMLITTISKAIDSLLYMAAIPLQHCLNTVDFIFAFSLCTTLVLTVGLLQPLLYLHRAGTFVCLKK